MLFNPTPIEKLTTLTNQLIEKHAAVANSSQALHDEISALKVTLKAKEDEVAQLNNELLEKDIEIEAIVSKIESLLG
jgi:predicted  nucleic acid-binding Zn-ribbon protein